MRSINKSSPLNFVTILSFHFFTFIFCFLCSDTDNWHYTTLNVITCVSVASFSDTHFGFFNIFFLIKMIDALFDLRDLIFIFWYHYRLKECIVSDICRWFQMNVIIFNNWSLLIFKIIIRVCISMAMLCPVVMFVWCFIDHIYDVRMGVWNQLGIHFIQFEVILFFSDMLYWYCLCDKCTFPRIKSDICSLYS